MKKRSLFVLTILISTQAFSKDTSTAVCTILNHVVNRQPLYVQVPLSQEDYEYEQTQGKNENQTYLAYRQKIENSNGVIQEYNSDAMLARSIYADICPASSAANANQSEDTNEGFRASNNGKSSKTKVMMPQ